MQVFKNTDNTIVTRSLADVDSYHFAAPVDERMLSGHTLCFYIER